MSSRTLKPTDPDAKRYEDLRKKQQQKKPVKPNPTQPEEVTHAD